MHRYLFSTKMGSIGEHEPSVPAVLNGPLRDAATHLVQLPPELIHSILSYLSPLEINKVSETCRELYRHATSDHIWQAFVQENVPGVRVTSPYPCATFRELFAAHDPRWFLPKYKIWFSDKDLTGKLVVARYDPRRGCIEGYQLLAVGNSNTFHTFQPENPIIIHAFEPSVSLHLDKPVLQLDVDHRLLAKSRGKADSGVETVVSPNGFTISYMRPTPSVSSGLPSPRYSYRVSASVPMATGSAPEAGVHTIRSNFTLARSLSATDAAAREAQPFPYGGAWPPPAVPATQRVAGDTPLQGLVSADIMGLRDSDRPRTRAEVCMTAFRVNTWLEMGVGPAAGYDDDDDGEAEAGLAQAMALQSLRGRRRELYPAGLRLGEEVATFSTLDPKLYTPTAARPWRGIWAGDYSGHGCEFLLIHQPDGEDDARRPGETDNQFADRVVHRGRLEAIKLTGDANVPRGEYTFVVEDLGRGGFVTSVTEPPFEGCRVVQSRGHVAETGFRQDTYVESQLILVSHNRLAQFWVGFQHISFFERVDVDKYLAPN